jgi:hypothetical protein
MYMNVKTGMRKPNMDHPASYRGRSVILITPEFQELHQNSGNMGKVAHSIVQMANNIGMKTSVIVPYSEDLTHITDWHTTTENEKHNFCHKSVEGISVYAIGKDNPFSEIVPPHENGYAQLKNFEDALSYFISHNRDCNDPPAILHFFDYPMGIVMYEMFKNNALLAPLANNLIFSPMDPTRFFNQFNNGEDGGMLDGLELGADVARKVVFWSERFHSEIQDQPRFANFLRAASGREAILPGDWHPSGKDNIHGNTLNGIQEVYMDVLYGSGINRSVHYMRSPNMLLDKVFYFIPELDDLSKPSRRDVVWNSFARVSNELQKNIKGGVQGIKILCGGRDDKVFYDYWQNLGGLVAFLEQVGMENEGKTLAEIESARYLLISDAGDFKRGGALAQAVGVEGMKGLTPEGRYTLGINCIKQSPVLFRQLPNHGYGWVSFAAPDNKCVPDGSPKAGNHYMWEVDSKVIITGKPAASVDEVKGLGCFVTDDDGKLIFFAEKAEPQVVKKALAMLGREVKDLYLNTMIFFLKQDIAKLLVNRYKNIPCKKNGKPFVSAYPLDISSHFIFPTTISEKDWKRIWQILQNVRANNVPPEVEYEHTANGLNILSIAGAMKKFEIPDIGQVFDNLEDWMEIHKMAQDINKEAKGISGVSLGNNCKWNDYGTLDVLDEMWKENLSTNRENRELERDRGGYPREANVYNVDMDNIKNNVTFIDTRTKKPLEKGEIPEKVLLSGVNFGYPINISADRVIVSENASSGIRLGQGVTDIQPNTVISGGDIEALVEAPRKSGVKSEDVPEAPPAILLNCFTNGKPLHVYRGMLHNSLSLRYADPKKLEKLGYTSKDTPIALTPLDFELKNATGEQSNYAVDELYPQIRDLLDPTKNMLDQSFIVEDGQGGVKRLGLNFYEVRGTQ